MNRARTHPELIEGCGRLKGMRTRSLNHSTYMLQYHIVWATKYRYQWLKPYVRTELRKSFQDTLKKYPTLFIFETNTDQDHVHLQIEIPPNITLSDAVSKLKSNSSLHLRKKFKFIRQMYLDKDGIWSVGYFVSSIGLNENQIRKYIQYQGKKEKPQNLRLF
jgi:putative transposase